VGPVWVEHLVRAGRPAFCLTGYAFTRLTRRHQAASRIPRISSSTRRN
jgi:hypothetical protein